MNEETMNKEVMTEESQNPAENVEETFADDMLSEAADSEGMGQEEQPLTDEELATLTSEQEFTDFTNAEITSMKEEMKAAEETMRENGRRILENLLNMDETGVIREESNSRQSLNIPFMAKSPGGTYTATPELEEFQETVQKYRAAAKSYTEYRRTRRNRANHIAGATMTGKIFSAQIQTIVENGKEVTQPVCVIVDGPVTVYIPVMQLTRNLRYSRDRTTREGLQTIANGRITSEVKYVVKSFRINEYGMGVAMATCLPLLDRDVYMNYIVRNFIKAGDIVAAKVTHVARNYIGVNAFGYETDINARNLPGYIQDLTTDDKYKINSEIPLKVVSVKYDTVNAETGEKLSPADQLRSLKVIFEGKETISKDTQYKLALRPGSNVMCTITGYGVDGSIFAATDVGNVALKVEVGEGMEVPDNNDKVLVNIMYMQNDGKVVGRITRNFK